MSKTFLDERRRSLEEAFFHKQNKKSLEAMKQKLLEQNTREGLRRASGLGDDAVLDHLVELGLTGETVATLSLVPLLKVAWADGKMQPTERQAILQAAEGKGLAKGSPAYSVLSDWLDAAPPAALFTAWQEYIRALAKEQLNPAQFELLKIQILGFARDVAEAAGGFLGISAIAKTEEGALAAIEDSFSIES